jgi:phosphopantothenoylcysteine decarboxylase/phosphopantothenate--cysteine ligase
MPGAAPAHGDTTPSAAPEGPRSPTIALAVSGSIAAYKAAEVARLLLKAGARVIPLMTRAAREFIGPMTLSGLCGEPVREAMFDPSFAGELHVELAREADVVLLVPATADLIARMASGRADDLLTALVLCAKGPVLAAPAMHPRMWSHPATQRAVAALRADGRVELIGPVDGEVASGERGVGRMADPDVIAKAALARATKQDLASLRVVVTAGPTIEDLDPVRFLGNRSTGKMGFAVAERAAARGAEVTLIAGPVNLPTPFGARRVDVRSALDMQGALRDALGPDLQGADVLIMSAAVADYRPASPSSTKRKRAAEPAALDLLPNPDLLAEIGAARARDASASRTKRPLLIGFAVETDTDERVVAEATRKLAAKQIDLIVANHASDAFGKDSNRATLIAAGSGGDGGSDGNGGSKGRVLPLGVLPKTALADQILNRALAELSR